MILQALYEYYQRDKNSVPLGWMRANLSFIIVIDGEGHYLRIEDCRNEKGKGQPYLLPKGEHNNSETPLLYWDNLMYALDYSDKPSKTTHNKHLSFVKRCKDVASKYNFESLQSVVLFYKHNELLKVYQDPLWETMIKNPNNNVSFKIQGSMRIVPCEGTFYEIVQSECVGNEKDDKKGICLVTGDYSTLVKTGTKTPIRGCKSSAKLVSFQVSSGYDSYGKEQGYNAPISVEADFAFSSAIKKMLDENSRNKYIIGNRTFLFWASKNDEVGQQAEESIISLFGFNNHKDDPDRNIEQVRKVFEAIYRGELKTTSEDRFYILGLAPNSARIAVTYWSELPIREFAGTICKHFEDMKICNYCNNNSVAIGLMLEAVTLKGVIKGNDSKLSPNLPDSIVKSIFQGLPYPQTLYASCIRRIRAETEKSKWDEAYRKGWIYIRAAIIKAYLNRLNNNEQKINVMLDKDNTNQGYLCGRLFAVLDKIQEEANNQHSIRERYMNSASSTPAAVFSTILNLSNHHFDNLKNEGRKIYFEKLKQEIISKIDAEGFKPQLDLQDQGRFFIGYYHQRQDFFTKNEENNNE